MDTAAKVIYPAKRLAKLTHKSSLAAKMVRCVGYGLFALVFRLLIFFSKDYRRCSRNYRFSLVFQNRREFKEPQQSQICTFINEDKSFAPFARGLCTCALQLTKNLQF